MDASGRSAFLPRLIGVGVRAGAFGALTLVALGTGAGASSPSGWVVKVSGALSGTLRAIPSDCGGTDAKGCLLYTSMSEYDVHSPAGAYSDPVIEATHDGGLTWSALAVPLAKPPIADVLTLSCPPSGDGCMGIGNLQDHFVLPPKGSTGRPAPLSGPLVISNLPTSPSPGA